MELAGYSIELLAFLFAVSILAGFIDTLGAGGGLIALPALMLSGLPPLSALGTNKLQGTMGTATATFMMFRKNKIYWQEVRPLMLTAFAGSAAGTVAVQFINTDVLSFVIPVVLFFIAVYFLLSPDLETLTAEPSFSRQKYQNLIVPSIGWYDGMFGPGTGSFFSLTGVLFKRNGLHSAVAIAKPLNFATNIASLIIFLSTGHIVWIVGLAMMLGQMAGAWAGSHCLFRVNPEILKKFIVVMCLAMLVKYMMQSGWGSGF